MGDKNIEAKIRDIRLRQLSVSMQACDILFQRLLKSARTEKIKFVDGREAYLRPFQEPHFDDDGYPQCCIDFVLPDGHLEFEIKLSGYGGAPRAFTHQGDPCKFCGKRYNEVDPGPCPARLPKDEEAQDG